LIQLIRKYKSVILFILTFLGVYVVLSMIYGFYLRTAASETYYPEYITHQVAVQSEWLVNFLGYDASIAPHPEEASMKLNVENVFVARIVEGCNAISVIILFIAFVVAFFQGWRATLFFVLGGSLLIYLINIVRIAILSIGFYKYPEHKMILHDIVFPGIIYGLVIVLWLLWVRNFKKQRL